MRLLLDSHVLLWWSGLQTGRLQQAVIRSIGEADQLFVSVVTIWELEIKRNTEKISFSADAWTRVEALGVSWLPIARDDAMAAGRLPLLHRDPFDRMLIAQAMQRGLTLATADRTLAEYGVAVLAA
jgi:PIN domain nuclease of toxin-antitoxin system